VETKDGYGNAVSLAYVPQTFGCDVGGDGSHLVVAVAEAFPQRSCLPSAVQGVWQEGAVCREDDLINPAEERGFGYAANDFPEQGEAHAAAW
jgi:hypothetical protein